MHANNHADGKTLVLSINSPVHRSGRTLPQVRSRIRRDIYLILQCIIMYTQILKLKTQYHNQIILVFNDESYSSMQTLTEYQD